MSNLKSLIKSVELFEKLASFSDRSTFLRRFAQTAEDLEGVDMSVVEQPQSLNVKAPTYTANPPKQNMSYNTAPRSVEQEQKQVQQAFRPVSKDFQRMLSKMLSTDGDYIPIKIDGLLGPSTRAAMESYSRKYKRPATLANVTETFRFWNNVARKGDAKKQVDMSVAEVDPYTMPQPAGTLPAGSANFPVKTQKTNHGAAGEPSPVAGPKA